MPVIEFSDILSEYLLEVGPANQTGMGLQPVNMTEVFSWTKLVGIDLTGWQATTLVQMSISYIEGQTLGEDRNSTAPFKTAEVNPETLAQGMDDIFAQINQSLRKKRT